MPAQRMTGCSSGRAHHLKDLPPLYRLTAVVAMRLDDHVRMQPHHVTVLLALALAVVGLINTRIHIDYMSQNAFWVGVTAYVVLALGDVVDGL